MPEQFGAPRVVTSGRGSQLVVGTTRNCVLEGTFTFDIRPVMQVRLLTMNWHQYWTEEYDKLKNNSTFLMNTAELRNVFFSVLTNTGTEIISPWFSIYLKNPTITSCQLLASVFNANDPQSDNHCALAFAPHCRDTLRSCGAWRHTPATNSSWQPAMTGPATFGTPWPTLLSGARILG